MAGTAVTAHHVPKRPSRPPAAGGTEASFIATVSASPWLAPSAAQRDTQD